VLLVAQVGLSGCRLAVTDLNGVVQESFYLEVDLAEGAGRLAARIVDAFDGMLAVENGRASLVAGIGLGMPSMIETLGYARSLGVASLEWSLEVFRSAIEGHFGAPVYLDRDVNLLGLAERRTSWPHVETFVCVKLGTLIDSAIIVNDSAVLGVNGVAGGLGHVKVRDSSESCTCGSVGCLDAVASGSALVRQLKQRGFDVTHVADVVALANDGHPEVLQSIREAGCRIGEALAMIVNLLNPEVVAFWGYLTAAESTLFAGIRQGLYENALPEASAPLGLVLSSLGDTAGTKGAAMHVIDRVLDDDHIDEILVSKSWPRSIVLAAG
jgi:predicted NBD/HSP70 family sugar kinase